MENAIPKLGIKMAPDEAKSYGNAINKKVIQRWDERVTKGPFMSRFLEGKTALAGDRAVF